MKVVHLCAQDFGGAGKAAYRLHKGLLAIGIDSTLIVLDKKSGDPSVKVISDYDQISPSYCEFPDSYNSVRMKLLWKHWAEIFREYKCRPGGLEIFTDSSSNVKLNLVKEVLDADIINLHWVAGMINFAELSASLKGKKIVWTLHDMNAFTGGCHYSSGCEKYLSSCGACPQLGSNDSNDLSKKIFDLKKKAYDKLGINIITPSKWLGNEAQRSSLFSKYNVNVIPYGLPLNVFKPVKKSEARGWANIPYSTKVVLFGADSLTNNRKGFKYLIEALNNIDTSETKDILLLTFGSSPVNLIDNSKYKVKNLGPISDERALAVIYSIADVYVIPSLQDNLPNTVLESLACGTPVAGFNIGGIPDMIEHKKNGYLAGNADPENLAKGILWLLDNSNEQLRDACRKFAELNFDLKIQAEAYLNLYRKINEKNIFPFERLTYSLKSHFDYFRKKEYDVELFGKEIDPSNCDLKVYQDLLVFTYIKENVPRGGRLLDIGGGNSRILNYYAKDYECWNLDKFEGIGNGTKIIPQVTYKIVLDYIGNFNSELPDNYFDFVFSISTLEHIGEDIEWHDKICKDIDRVSKNNGVNLHCFDVILNNSKNGKKVNWTCGLLPFMFDRYQTKQKYSGLKEILEDDDLFFLSQSFYKNSWQKITKEEYSDFGIPISYNILWQTKKRVNSPTILSRNNKFKKISIITPSYNQAEFLEETIDSVLSQNYPDLEYVIMDGGSTDGSVDIIKKYIRYLKYWQSKPDGGQYSAINAGFGHTMGEIMGWINSDDKFHPQSLFKVNEAFKRENVRWITGRPTAWNSNGSLKMISPNLPNWSREKILKKGYRDAFIQQESTFWKRSLWKEAGEYLSTESDLVGDIELWLRFFRYDELYTIDDLLGGYRYQPNQKTATHLNDYILEADLLVDKELDLINKNKFNRSKPFPGVIKINSVPYLQETIINIGLPKSDDFVLATSLNPNGGSNQFKAYQSWVDSSFKVVSFNCHEEIKILKPFYPNVIFYPLGRTAYSKTGKYLIYLDDILKGLKEFPNQHYGLINSDIILNTQLINKEIFKNKLKENLQKGILYSNRIDIKEPENIEGEEYKVGFDLFFFSKNHMEKINGLDLIIGLPWWDYYFLLTAVFNSIEIIKINEKIAFHIKHTSFYEENMWYELGGTVLDYLNKMMKSAGINVEANIGTNEKTANIFKLSRVCLELIKNKSQIFPTDSGADEMVNANLYRKNNDSTLTDKILVSAIVSTYNSEEFIEGCLEDLVNQTIYKKGQLEIIVIDSQSQQNEKTIVEEYQSKYPNIVFQRTNERETLYAAWNRGIKLAKGKYITNANTDDRHKTDALEVFSSALDENSDIDLVYADCKQGNTANETFEKCSSSIIYNYPDYSPPVSLLYFQFGPQPVWRKGVHDKIGYFNANLSAIGDYDFNIRFALTGLKAKKINEVLGIFYLNPDSITNTNQNQQLEKRQVQNFYLNEANIIKLYENAGWNVNSDFDIANLLNNFGVTALQFKLPWREKFDSNLELAFLCFTSARRYTNKSEALDNNIIQLHAILKKGAKIDPLHFRRNIVSSNEHKNSLTKRKTAKKVITVVAGDGDNFSFIKPILNYLSNKNFLINTYKLKDINDSNINNIINQSDLIWYEWGNGPVVEMSKLFKSCPAVCRVHRYEAYYEPISKINWYNVDKLILINNVFLDVILKNWDNNLLHKTDVKIIPNPVTCKGEFKVRKNNYNIAYISRFHRDKNPILMIQILRKLVEVDRRYKVFMIGRIQDQSLYEECVELINSLGLKDNFEYQGIINDVEKWLNDKSFLLSTSVVESQGLAIMEAMVMGIKPVIFSGLGLNSIYPQSLLFKNVEEAVSLITETKYDSYYYNSFVKESYDESIILPQIEAIVNDLISRYSNTENKQILDKSFNKIDSNDKPFISICIPTYNRSNYLKDSIKSALNQKYDNYEIIIVDDGSTDKTKEVVQSFGNEKICYIQTEHAGGPAARNRIIEEVKGEFILWLGDDDLLDKNILKKYADYINAYPDVELFYSYYKMHSVSNNQTEIRKYKDWYFDRDKLLSELLYTAQFMDGGGLFKKNIFDKIGLYNNNFIRAHDYEIAFRIASDSSIKLKLIPEPLYTYNLYDEGNLSGTLKQKDFRYDCVILDNVLSRDNLSKIFPETTENNFKSALIYFNLALRYLRLECFPRAIELLEKSISINPQPKNVTLLDELKSKYSLLLSEHKKITEDISLYPDNSQLKSLLKDIDRMGVPFKKKDFFPKTEKSINSLINKKAENFEQYEEKEKEEYLISIIIPCYNQGEYLKDALNSVIQQTFKNFECIIVNDGSTDNSKEIAKDFINNNPTINISLITTKNGGLSSARNKGIKKAKGDFILPLDADDTLKVNSLEKFIDVANANKNCDIFYPDYETFGAINKYVECISEAEFQNPLRDENGLPYSSFYKKEVWVKNGGYNPNMIWGFEDWDFWLSSLKNGFSAKKIPEALFNYRLKTQSMITDALKFRDQLLAIMAINHKNLYDEFTIKKAMEFIVANPFISVIIPTYNRPDALKKAVQSVIYQSFPLFEIIIVNDAGEDMRNVLDEFKDVRIRYIRHKSNKGLAAARNSGIKAAKGNFVALLDDDDIFYPGHLETAVRFLSKGEKIVYTDAVRVSYKKENNEYQEVARNVPYSFDYDRNKLLIGNIAPVNCFVFEKTLVEKSGLFDESLPVLEDWDFWLRLSSLTEFKHIKESTVQVNWYVDGSTMTSSKGKDFEVARNKIYKKFENEIQKITNKNEIIEEFNSIWRNDFKTKSPTVSIIALSYNQIKYTKEFIQSVFEFTTIPFELIIIDNNSDSETVEYLKEIDKSKENTRVIFNQKNFGFPKGINQAIKEARGKYLLIANNDIVVTKGWFERIAEVAESDNKIGIVGPISNYVSGMQFDKNARYSNLKQMHEYVVNIRVKNLGKTLHFPRITFLCALIKREVIEKIGGLDERFSPGNFEDDDFCLRAQIAGFKTVIAQDVFIHHYGSKSFTAEGMEKYKTRLEINQKIFINKWGATPEEIWLKGKQIKGRKIMFTLNKNEFKENLERALSLIEEKDYDVALDYLNNSVEVYNNFDHDEHDPDLANLLNLAGNVSFLNGNPEAAQKYFENALNEDSSSSHACTGLGDVLFVSKNYEGAKTMYQWGVKNNFENKAAKNGLVKVNKILNLQANDNSLSRLKEEINIPVKLNEEINIPESVYENKEPEENKLINEAYEMFNEKKFESALNKLKKAESMFNGQLTKPKDPEFASSFYNFKGFNYLGLNDIVNAKNCFQKALEINPDSSQAIAGLGEVLFLSKFDEEAKLMFEKAVNKNPNNLFAIGGLKKVNKLLNFDEDHSSLTQRLNSEDKLKIYHRDDIGILFNKLQLLGKGAEVGVQAGEYSRTIRSTWEGEELYLIDWWRYSPNYKDIANAPDEKQKELYLSVVKKFMDDHTVHILRKESIEASKQFSDEYFDWIYLDADHSYEGCLKDLKAWYPKLKKGGIFSGHDYFDGSYTGGIFGVKSAVDSFISDKEVNIYTTEENTVRSWYFIKPGSNLPETVLKSNDDNEGQINSDLQKLQMVLNEILESSFELFGLKHFDEAIDALNRSEDIFYSQNNKELISAFENMKGFNYLGINDKVRARECFETALNINAESSQACAGLGELFYLDGKDNEAKTMYEFAVKNNPDNQYAVTGLVKVNKILNLPDMHNTVLQ